MQSDCVLAREKKFHPIIAHVSVGHHSIDSVAYPFFWSWKDASTKVQNMHHQYLLVKKKLLSSSSASVNEIDWSQGLSRWPNFLRYRDVFGDTPLPLKPSDPTSSIIFPKHLGSTANADGGLGLGLGYECLDEDGEFDYEEAPPPLLLPPPELQSHSERRKKKKWRREGREWARFSLALVQLQERPG